MSVWMMVPSWMLVRAPIRIGSVKSMIGHLKSAAGAASFIKVAMALRERVLPPSINFRKARADVPLDKVPLQVQTKTEPWTGDHPHYAGVSAFGFGGTNFHAVLEAFDPARHAAWVSPQPTKRAPPPMLAGPTTDYPVPAGIWAVFNQITGAKEAVPMIDSPHNHLATPAMQRPYTKRAAEWLDILVRGGDPTRP